jgi:lysozyme
MRRALSLLALSLLVPTAACSGAAEDFSTEDDEQLLRLCAAGPTVEGIDVSYHQSTIDWDKVVAAAPLKFAFIRVSDSTRVTDPQFARNWKEAKRVGLVRGVYQFWRPSVDTDAQVDLALAQIEAAGGLEPDDLGVVLDAEVAEGLPAKTILPRMQKWLDRMEQATGKKPIIYTSWGFWAGLGSPTTFGAYPLWVANYKVSCPRMPDGSWSAWSFWQYSDRGRLNGIRASVDRNVFNGTLPQLQALARRDP